MVASVVDRARPVALSPRVIRVEGGRPLRGEVVIGGAKNAALPALAATLLTSEECVLNNVPDLADIYTMIDLLRSLGASAEFDVSRRQVRVRANEITSVDAPPDLVAKMRASFLVAGPLLARFKHMSASTPGGCKLGARPVDVDVRGFRRMGAKVEFSEQEVSARCDGLTGARIYMDYPSHTGTENLLMAATLANGRTTIVNAACEPEITYLGDLLIRMGARITGHGTPTISVEGVDRLHGVSDNVLPDRLEAGTFAIGAVITGGEVEIKNVRETDMLPLTAKLHEAGARIWQDENSMLVRAESTLKAVEIQTLPFPGFPTDLQAPFAVLMTQSHGLSKIHERVFEGRLRYTDELKQMGADIWVETYGDGETRKYGTHAEITGPTPLHGARVQAIDIRAGAGVVLAGLVATGETVITDIHHLARGYENLVEKLSDLGAAVSFGDDDVA
jgi:UDP-N-acetylglucosamine 1-carboxyvinyltransferase